MPEPNGKTATREQLLRLRQVREDFHKLYYETRWHGGPWMGVPTWKCPMDLMTYQEILTERQPDLIIETGTAAGGSAIFMATICDLLEHGRIISIDLDPLDPLPEHPRVTWVRGNSVDPAVVADIRGEAAGAERVMVVLDSDHAEQHVLAEMEAYGPLVTLRQYLIVEDTNINGHPVLPEHGPGPWEAVGKFLPKHQEFSIDIKREKYLLSFNPGGYLERVK